MPPEASLSPAQRHLEDALPAQWRAPLAQLLAAWCALSLLFRQDWAAMAHQWWDSSTYNHILLVPLILGWLVWQRRSALAAIAPDGWWPGLLLVGGALFLWLLGAVSGVDTARQLGLVCAMIGCVSAVLGLRASWLLMFPMAYALFLVPVGDELVPTLQMVTAKIVIVLTHFSGVSAEIDGVFINTPAGLFEVAEACSGVKFLVAMVALGVLACHVGFLSWRRRAAFLALCVVVPILANGIRAWGTIYLAQIYGIEFAAGFDHIFYGWVFFALIVALLVGLGWRFFDRPADDIEAVGGSVLLGKLADLRISGGVAFAGTVAMAAVVAFWAASSARAEAAIPAEISLPKVAGWQLVDYRPAVWWEPQAGGADHRLLGRYRDDAGHEVDVFIALYGGQGPGREASGFGEGALMPDTDWRWVRDETPIASAHVQRLQAGLEHQRVAATFYRRGDLLTGSSSGLRLATMRDRLILEARPTATLIVSTEEGGAHSARDNVRAFIQSVEPLGEWMDGITKLP